MIKFQTLLLICIVIFICVLAVVVAVTHYELSELDYTIQEYVVRPGDTLWEIWQENYSQYYSYAEFLSNFKQDNGREQSGIIAGETILLRDIVKEE